MLIMLISRIYKALKSITRKISKKDILLSANPKDTMITERIKQLRTERRMAQRKLVFKKIDGDHYILNWRKKVNNDAV
jgi:enterochelin esterase-like enzyme